VNINGSTRGPTSWSPGSRLSRASSSGRLEHSINFIEDFRNYLWRLEKSRRLLNVPEHAFSHAPDADHRPHPAAAGGVPD
jgi:hypothetical protein